MLELSFLDWANAGAVAASAPTSRQPAASRAGNLFFIENSSRRGIARIHWLQVCGKLGALLGTLPRTFHVAQTEPKTVHCLRGYAACPRYWTRNMSLATLNDIFFAAVARNLDRIMLYR